MTRVALRRARGANVPQSGALARATRRFRADFQQRGGGAAPAAATVARGVDRRGEGRRRSAEQAGGRRAGARVARFSSGRAKSGRSVADPAGSRSGRRIDASRVSRAWFRQTEPQADHRITSRPSCSGSPEEPSVQGHRQPPRLRRWRVAVALARGTAASSGRDCRAFSAARLRDRARTERVGEFVRSATGPQPRARGRRVAQAPESSRRDASVSGHCTSSSFAASATSRCETVCRPRCRCL